MQRVIEILIERRLKKECERGATQIYKQKKEVEKKPKHF